MCMMHRAAVGHIFVLNHDTIVVEDHISVESVDLFQVTNDVVNLVSTRCSLQVSENSCTFQSQFRAIEILDGGGRALTAIFIAFGGLLIMCKLTLGETSPSKWKTPFYGLQNYKRNL